MSAMWVSVLHPYSKFERRRHPLPKTWVIFGHGVNWPGDLWTAKWGYGSPVSWASFLPSSSFLRPCVFDLVSDTRQTDNGH